MKVIDRAGPLELSYMTSVVFRWSRLHGRLHPDCSATPSEQLAHFGPGGFAPDTTLITMHCGLQATGFVLVTSMTLALLGKQYDAVDLGTLKIQLQTQAATPWADGLIQLLALSSSTLRWCFHSLSKVLRLPQTCQGALAWAAN